MTFKGAISLVINLSAYLYELKGFLGITYEELIFKLEEIRVCRLFLLKLLTGDYKRNTGKVHGIEYSAEAQDNNTVNKNTLVSSTEYELSPVALETVENL